MKRCFCFFLVGLSLALHPASAAPKPAPAKPASPAFEPGAHAILKKVFDHYRGLRSYSGMMKWSRGGTSLAEWQTETRYGQTSIRVAQPKIYLTLRLDRGDMTQRYIDDGENCIVNILPGDAMEFSHDFLKQDALWKYAEASEFGVKELLQGRNPLEPFGPYVKSIAAGTPRNKDEAHVIVRLEAPKSSAQIDYFLGLKDLSLLGVKLHQEVDGQTLDRTEDHAEIKFNPKR